MHTNDVQFNLRKRHPIGRLRVPLQTLQSVFSRTWLNNTLDVSYGPTAGQQLDIFPAHEANAPVFVFIHGGYFRALDKRQYAFLASKLVRRGYTLVLLNYDLAPKVTVAEIIAQNIRGLAWVHRNIAQWHGDPKRLIICGHSVGAFLVAKLLEHPWEDGTGEAIEKAILLSGLYDLEPMRLSYLNDSLNLSQSDTQRLSPIRGTLEFAPPVLIAVGGKESDVFVRQSKEYAARLESQGHILELALLEGKNHYDMPHLIGKKNTAISRFLDSRL